VPAVPYNKDQDPALQGLFSRDDLKKARRIVIKVGTSVLTRENEYGVSLTRMAAIVEQVCELVHSGREVVIVTSGAVGFGKMRLQVQSVMSQTVRHTLSYGASRSTPLDSRACAAAGQSGLMTLYSAMFNQYGVSIAQVLVTMSDFQSEAHRVNMCETIKELISLGIVPVCNENDVFYSNSASRDFVMSHEDVVLATFNPNFNKETASFSAGGRRIGGERERDADGVEKEDKVLRLTANDSLASLLAVRLDAQLLMLLTSVDGVYCSIPGRPTTAGTAPKLLSCFSPDDPGTKIVEYGKDQRVGRGGMAAKVAAAVFALKHGVPSVIANGTRQDTIKDILAGKAVGTFFTRRKEDQTPPHIMAIAAKAAGKVLAGLPSGQRRKVLEQISNGIKNRASSVMEANSRDVAELQERSNTEDMAMGVYNSRIKQLRLSRARLNSLIKGIDHLAMTAGDSVGRNLQWCKLSEGLYLEQEAAPLGTVLCVSEALPDVLPQVAALCIASGNALLMRGSGDIKHTMQAFHSIIASALDAAKVPHEAVALLESRGYVNDLLQLEEHVNLVIPRGGKALTEYIRANSRIPVMGGPSGPGYVYVHHDADLDMAIRVAVDSKCEMSGGHPEMGVLLLHSRWLEQGKLEDFTGPLQRAGVAVLAGPRVRSLFAPQASKLVAARELGSDYTHGECAVEVVESVEQAMDLVRQHGTGCVDVIVTEDEATARSFLKQVGSACVLHNCSTRLADGYFFGMGAEAAFGSMRDGDHRGPVGIEGLMMGKWILRGKGHVSADFLASEGHARLGEGTGASALIHEKKCVTCGLQIRD